MAKRTFLAGVTSQTIDVFVQDSSSTIGAGLAALAFGTSGLKAYYRKGATGSATSITLATQTVGGAWSSGGFVEIDATNQKGMYRFDIPDTVLASTPFATIYFYGASNMAPVVAELEIVSYNPFDAVRLGLTALPNAAAEASGGLFTRGTGAGQINQDANGRVDVSLKAILGTALTETAGLLAGGFKKFFNVATPTGTVNSIPDAVAGATGGLFIAGTNAATTVTTALTTTFTGNLTGSVGSVTGAVGSVTGAVGSVTGAVGSVTGAVGSVATDGITLASLKAETGLKSIRSNTAQAGGNTSITLDASASSTTDFYVGLWVSITGATGIGQARVITAYNGTTKVATIAPAWATNPDVTSTFALMTAAQITGVQGNVTGSVASVTGAVGSVTGAVGSVTGAVGSVTGAVGSVAAGGIAASSFAAGAIDATAIAADAIGSSELATSAVTEIVNAILAATVEGTYTIQQVLKLYNSALASKVSGAATTTIVFRDIGDSKDRITATVDANGNRSALTLDVT